MNSFQRDPGRLIGAAILIGLGVLFFVLQNLDVAIDWDQIWPFIIIAPGAIFLIVGLIGGVQTAPLVIPGLVVSGTGVILLVQNATNTWESWAYIWAVYPILAGIGLIYAGWRTQKPQMVRSGQTATVVGVVMFLIFGGMFGLGGINWGQAWPVVLIVIGVFLLFGNRLPGFAGNFSTDEKPKREE